VAQLVVVLGGALVAGSSLAASVLNSGSSAVVLVVVEDGTKTEIALDAGGSDVICASGCFLTLPNGDRIGLSGGETVEIKDGVATIK
jgi:phage gp45-like